MEGAAITFGTVNNAVLNLYSVNGQLVKTITAADTDMIRWDGDVAPGMYLYSLELDNTSHTGRTVVTK
jgi:hypothetical protein